MHPREAAARTVVIIEVCVLVKPFCARIYGCATENALTASPPETRSSSVHPAQIAQA